MTAETLPAMRDLGEKGFLAALLPTLQADIRFVNGFGHDASVIDIGLPEINLVMKIDRAAKPIAALNGWTDYRAWGRIAVTANCSDILAVGGEPTAFMLSISVAGETSANMVAEIVAGAAEACRARNVAFLGGDTKEATGLNIVGSALGTIAKGRHFDRGGGKVGDLIVLAGSLGGFLGGYWTCSQSAVPPEAAVRYLAEPQAAWAEARELANLSGIRSACDLSDGLGSSALNLVTPGLGALLIFDKLPFHPLARESAAMRDVDLLPYAFGVGDWGILYAVDPAAWSDIERLRDSGLLINIVGEVIPYPGLTLRRGGFFSLTVPEHEHFRHRMEDQGGYLYAHEKNLLSRPVSSDFSLQPVVVQ